MRYVVVITTEPKDDATGVNPNPEDVRARLRDVLVDVTKHDDVIDWRVTAVDAIETVVVV